MEGERAHDDCERAHEDSDRRHEDDSVSSIQYRRLCKGEFETLKEGQRVTWGKLDALTARLFIGNGQASFVSRIEANELKIQLVMWIFCSVGAALIVSVVALFFGANK